MKGKKAVGIVLETFILALSASTVCHLRNRHSYFLILGDKRLLSGLLRKCSWFQGHNKRFPKYPGQKLTIQKTETPFCWWKSTDSYEIYIFLSLENLCTILLARERTWKRIFTVIVNYHKIVQKKQIMPSKTPINWLFNDIWCYLFIACSNLKLTFLSKQL